MNKIYKHVNDLGIAAYLLMHGYDIGGKKGKSYYLEVDKKEISSFNKLILGYLNERNYHLFDHCIMTLKKVPEINVDGHSSKAINDLGLAAYIFMHKFNLAGRQGSSFYFSVNDNDEETQFNKLTLEYLNSPFHRFDHCIMSLKKTPEGLPK